MDIENLRRIESCLKKNLADFQREYYHIKSAFNEKERRFRKDKVDRLIEDGMKILESNSAQLFDIIYPDVRSAISRSICYASLRHAEVFGGEMPKHIDLISAYVLQAGKGIWIVP